MGRRLIEFPALAIIARGGGPCQYGALVSAIYIDQHRYVSLRETWPMPPADAM